MSPSSTKFLWGSLDGLQLLQGAPREPLLSPSGLTPGGEFLLLDVVAAVLAAYLYGICGSIIAIKIVFYLKKSDLLRQHRGLL